METQRQASDVHQTGPSEAEACGGSSAQIQGGAPAAAADLRDFSATMQTPSFQPMPVSCGQDSFISAVFAGQYMFFPDVVMHLDRVL